MTSKWSKLEGESTMAKRSKTKKPVDTKVFTQTAKKTKAVNVSPKNMRGGTRL